MYIRAVHAESSLQVLRQLIRDNPLGLLTTAITSVEHPFLQSSHIPFLLDVDDEASETETGRLRGHLARQNPHSKAMMDELTARPDLAGVLERDVLVIFTARDHHYLTPKFYAETKPATGKVVPTWNYAAAQVYGRARVYYSNSATAGGGDAGETSRFLQTQISDLTRHAETHIMNHVDGDDAAADDSKPKDWKVTDAPDRYIDILKKNIIGIEIDIDRLEGKFKMSQEMGKGDREGVVEGLRGLESEAARRVGDVVKERSDAKNDERRPAT